MLICYVAVEKEYGTLMWSNCVHQHFSEYATSLPTSCLHSGILFPRMIAVKYLFYPSCKVHPFTVFLLIVTLFP